jgi:diguanylate cyclase (GGDEF)-like protein
MIEIEKLGSDKAKHEHYKKGQIIINDSESASDKMYILLEGTVGVFKNYREDSEVHITNLEIGDFFGEMSLFLNRERTATIVANENVTVYVIDRTSIFEHLRRYPESAFSFIQVLCMRLDNTNVTSAKNSVQYMEDISILRQIKDELEATSYTDALTELYNRRFFMDNVNHFIKMAEENEKTPFIALFDIDHFKKVNDTYGHQSGDDVLKEVAKTARTTLAGGDVVARYGGEEFIILIVAQDEREAFERIEAVRENIALTSVPYASGKISVTISSGIEKASSECNVENTIAEADRLLYVAKNGGRNQTVIKSVVNP